jgi:hypothetical protein
MSTKIYSGLRLPFSDIRKVLTVLDEVGVRYDKLSRRVQVERLAKQTVEIIDMKWYWPEKLTERFETVDFSNPLSVASQRIAQAKDGIRKTGIRNPEFDDEFEVVIFPGRGHTLMIPYCENPAYFKLLKDHPKVEEYGYWDNVDMPEGMTAKRWKLRRDTWEKAMPGSISPARAGLTRTYHDQWSPSFSAEEVMKHLPSMNERAKDLCWDRLMATEVQKLKRPKAVEISDLMRLYDEVRHKVKEKPSILEDAVADFVRRAPRLTVELLTGR